MSLLDLEGMFAVPGYGKDAAVDTTPSKIGVRPRAGQDVCAGVGMGKVQVQ